MIHIRRARARERKANILKWHIMATDKRRENEQTNECLGYAYYPKCTEFFHIKATISFSIKWNIKRTSLNRWKCCKNSSLYDDVRTYVLCTVRRGVVSCIACYALTTHRAPHSIILSLSIFSLNLSTYHRRPYSKFILRIESGCAFRWISSFFVTVVVSSSTAVSFSPLFIFDFFLFFSDDDENLIKRFTKREKRTTNETINDSKEEREEQRRRKDEKKKIARLKLVNHPLISGLGTP